MGNWEDEKLDELPLDLRDLGWTPDLAEHLDDPAIGGSIPGRVASRNGKHYVVITSEGEVPAIVSNAFKRSAQAKSDLPAVGDWVVLERIENMSSLHIVSLFPRKNKLSRMGAGDKTEEQIVASNIDTVFIVTTVDHDFNIRRLERYLVMANEMGVRPVIILNKIDTFSEVERSLDPFIMQIHRIANDVPVIAISARDGSNIEKISELVEPGKTIVLVGSSGVGKSTLINQMLGYSRQAVGEIRGSDSKGRHVTSSRELILLPNGGMMIDNPGIRELQLWSSGIGISKTFEDIEGLGRSCRFKDCGHETEPGCAVIEAVENGTLAEDRLYSYRKLMRELEHARLRRSVHERKKAERKLGKMYRTGKEIRRNKGRE